MFKIDKVKVNDVQTIESITPCSLDVDFHFDINGERNIPKFLVTIRFDHTVSSGSRLMKEIKAEGPYTPAINTGQDNDDFWLDVNDTIGSEINHRLFNVPQEERDIVIKEIFEKIEDVVKTLGIEIKL